MNDIKDEQLDEYFRNAESWADDQQRSSQRSVRLAWTIAAVAAAIALAEAFALAALVPLKREVPYTLLVDRQTGYVETLKPLDAQQVTADTALTRSFLVQYVIARESFAIDGLQADYRKVGLMSAESAREDYLSLMRADNPVGPLAILPRRATISVQVRSVSSLSPQTALVRFSTVRTDPGAGPQPAQHWAAVIAYGYSNAAMSAEDRLANPLGFQVTRYRKDAETLVEAEAAGLPEVAPVPATVAAPTAGRSAP
jgi:type IV secretion system protein VirB8